MFDLKKYTRMCQLADKIEFLENAFITSTKSSSAYTTQLKRYRTQYAKLYAEFNGRLDLPINLKDYVHNLIKYLNNLNPDGEKWLYQYEELMHHVTEQEHFYGTHTYHSYKYQVNLLNGDRVIPVCVVNRELNYVNDKQTINLLHDTMLAPFSFRLDETSDEFDEKTSKELKKIYLKTYIQGKQAKVNSEMTLIQQDIIRLQKQYKDKQNEYWDYNDYLKNLDEQEEINTKQ